MLADDIMAAIESVVHSGRFIGGPEVAAFEAEMREFAGVKHAISCANGTDALRMALAALKLGPGDGVIVPDFTFFATAEAVALQQGIPVFCDIDERSYNISLDSLRQVIADVKKEGLLNLRGIIAVGLFGLPADLPALREICDAEGLFLIHDAAQCFGAEINGESCMRTAEISTTSFFPAKPLGCMGDGGAVFTDDDQLAAHMLSYKFHGKGSQKYEHIMVGENSRLDALQAAILRIRLKHFAEVEMAEADKRAAEYDELLAEFADDKLLLPRIPENMTSTWAQYCLQAEDSEKRDKIREKLQAQEIPTMIYYPAPISAQEAMCDYRRYTPGDGCCQAGASLRPNSFKVCERIFALPMGPYAETAEVAAKLKKVMAEIYA